MFRIKTAPESICLYLRGGGGGGGGFCEGGPLKVLNKILEKYLRKNSFLLKLQVLNLIHSHVIFKVSTKSVSNLNNTFGRTASINQNCY